MDDPSSGDGPSELFIDETTRAKTNLKILVYAEVDDPESAETAPTLEEAALRLIFLKRGVIRITGDWIARGKNGSLDVVYVQQFWPEHTQQYLAWTLHELIRDAIAKELEDEPKD